MTAAIFAASVGNHGCLRVLREAGADLNLKDKGGLTAWSFAHNHGREECLALLEDASRGPNDSCCERVSRRIAALPTFLFKP